MQRTKRRATLLVFFEKENMQATVGPQELKGEILEHAVIKEATYCSGVRKQGPHLELEVEFQGPYTYLAADAKAICEEKYGRVTKITLISGLQETG